MLSLACSLTKSQRPKRYVAKRISFTPSTLPDLNGIRPVPQVCFLMPSSSPRCAQFPRAQDKVHFYIKLKELRDQMKGLTSNGEVLETQYSFDLQLAKGNRHHGFSKTPHLKEICVSFYFFIEAS